MIVNSGFNFHRHVDYIVGRAGTMMNNLSRSTVCRSTGFMVTSWVTYIHPLIEYSSCSWNVGYLLDVQRLESVQRSWSREVHGMRGSDYAARLRSIGLFTVKS